MLFLVLLGGIIMSSGPRRQRRRRKPARPFASGRSSRLVTGGSSAFSGRGGAHRGCRAQRAWPHHDLLFLAGQYQHVLIRFQAPARGQQKPTSAAAAVPAPPPAVSRPLPRSAGRGGGGIIERAAHGLDRQRRSPCDCFSYRRTRNIIRRSLSSTALRANMASKPAA